MESKSRYASQVKLQSSKPSKFDYVPGKMFKVDKSSEPKSRKSRKQRNMIYNNINTVIPFVIFPQKTDFLSFFSRGTRHRPTI